MKLDKHVVDMFTELTKPADDVKMEKTCYGTISVVDGTRYVKLDGSDLLVPAASTVKTSHGDRVTVLMKNHSLTVTGNLTAPATDGEGGSSGEAGTAATIEVGTVTTGEAGSSASVTNVGTKSEAIFDFVIPRGDKGEKGDTGPQGPQGEKGDTGTWDGTIPDHQHTVSDITDFPTSLPANGGNADTLDGKHANDFVQKTGDSMSGNLRMESNQLWFGIGGINQFYFENTNGDISLKNHDGATVFAANYYGSYATHADTVDGKHAENFMQWLGAPSDTNIMNDANYKVDYHCNIGDGTLIGLPVAGWYHVVYYMHANVNGFGMQIAYPLNFDGHTFIRWANGTMWGDWKNVADGGNADTLDGKHAIDFFNNIAGIISPETSGKATLMEYISTLDSATSNFYASEFDDLPTNNWGYNVTVYKAGGAVYVIAYRALSNREIYVRDFAISGEWNGDWTRLNDGGNADTLDGFHANEIASNPNLLINPDFKINQRGKTEYTGISAYTYTVDRWCIWKYNCDAYGTVTVNNDGSLSVDGVKGANDAILTQELENGAELVGKTITLSLEIEEIAGSIIVQQHYNASSSLTVSAPGIHKVTFEWQEATKYRIVINNTNCSHYKIKWAKLEPGSIATPFIPPDPATELVKCQRYYYNSNGQIVFCARSGMVPYQNYYTLPVTMRANPTITVYDAEGTAGYASLRRDNSAKVAISTTCANGRDFNLWAPNSDMTVNSEYRISFTASAEL